jgi:hypothetical protein
VSPDANRTRVADAVFDATSKAEKRVETNVSALFHICFISAQRPSAIDPPVSHLTAAQHGLC